MRCPCCRTQVVCWSSKLFFHKMPFSKSTTLPKIIRRITTVHGHQQGPWESTLVSNSPWCNHQMVTFQACACSVYQALFSLSHCPCSWEPGYELVIHAYFHLMFNSWDGQGRQQQQLWALGRHLGMTRAWCRIHCLLYVYAAHKYAYAHRTPRYFSCIM